MGWGWVSAGRERLWPCCHSVGGPGGHGQSLARLMCSAGGTALCQGHVQGVPPALSVPDPSALVDPGLSETPGPLLGWGHLQGQR